ncbi:MAG: hypothetical protein ACFFDC_13380, partial [Promethearchaeota archaeon]
IMKFDREVGKVLSQSEAFFTVDMNRKGVKEVIQKNPSILMEKIEELFDIPINMNPETDLSRYSVNSENEMEVFALFRELIEVIIRVKENPEIAYR